MIHIKRVTRGPHLTVFAWVVSLKILAYHVIVAQGALPDRVRVDDFCPDYTGDGAGPPPLRRRRRRCRTSEQRRQIRVEDLVCELETLPLLCVVTSHLETRQATRAQHHVAKKGACALKEHISSRGRPDRRGGCTACTERAQDRDGARRAVSRLHRRFHEHVEYLHVSRGRKSVCKSPCRLVVREPLPRWAFDQA